MTIKRTLSITMVLLVGALAVVALAACGSSSTASTSSSAAAGTGASTSRTQLQACLKQHGVKLPGSFAKGKHQPAQGSTPPKGGTPPSSGSSSGPPKGGFGAQPNHAGSQKVQAALKACGAKLGARPGNAAAAAKPSTAASAKFSACVKQHGYTLPQANTSGNGSVYPAKIEHNTKFQAAAKACASDLPASSTGSSDSTDGSDQ